jgi:hypothetical protein
LADADSYQHQNVLFGILALQRMTQSAYRQTGQFLPGYKASLDLLAAGGKILPADLNGIGKGVWGS